MMLLNDSLNCFVFSKAIEIVDLLPIIQPKKSKHKQLESEVYILTVMVITYSYTPPTHRHT